MEAHGTVLVRRPIEIEGLSKAFSQGTQDQQFCSIGSVKSNIGHAESAAGISGLTKQLQLHHKTIVKSLHSAELNPYLKFEETPFTYSDRLLRGSDRQLKKTVKSHIIRAGPGSVPSVHQVRMPISF
ncbi:hypothetical protein QNN00_18680 [Bacillus velezensis]|nr:hypothetical protein [Bacillus velezensis]